MLFNSLEFLVFFPIVIALYFAIPAKFRWILLLIASYYFYMCWNEKYIILIMGSTIVDYFSGIYISKSDNKRVKKILLTASLITNLGLLFSFKYFNFFSDSILVLFEKINLIKDTPTLKVLLPVGISFYTFQTLSYTIDVYKGTKTPEKHFGKFALYVSFFPQLVAGPIERSQRLMPQIHQHFKFDYARIREGLYLMAWGFFKKVVIADRLAEYADVVFSNPDNYHGLQAIFANLFFSFQIYCDFSGYSDIAIGSALILGYRLMTNFRRPYLSRSIHEFWGRWHISLSTWFRDYVYIPLGGNRVRKWRWYYNLFITFLISGFWHGANWTFIVWGMLHGFYLIFAIVTEKTRLRTNNFMFGSNKAVDKIWQTVLTFILAYFAWIFFRAESVSDAFTIIRNLFIFDSNGAVNLFKFKSDFVLSLLLIAVLMFVEFFEERFQLADRLRSSRAYVKWTLLIIVLFSIMFLGKWNSEQFLYFQF